MGPREIVDVNVIADAGAVGSGVVVAEDGDGFLFPKRDLKNVGNQMRLGAMILSVGFPGAGDVEIAKAGDSGNRGCDGTNRACVPPEVSIRRTRWWDGAARLPRWACARDFRRGRPWRKKQISSPCERACSRTRSACSRCCCGNKVRGRAWIRRPRSRPRSEPRRRTGRARTRLRGWRDGSDPRQSVRRLAARPSAWPCERLSRIVTR